MCSARTKAWLGRVVPVALLPAILAVGILTAWQGGFLAGSGDVADGDLVVGDLDDGEMNEMRDMTGVDAGAGADGAGTSVAGAGSADSADSAGAMGVSGAGVACPVPLPSAYRTVAYSRGTAIERWQASSDMSCRDGARELLLTLRAEGFELVKAGFLDVSEEMWGCTVKTDEGESLVISLVPEKFGSVRDEQNRLTLTIVRIGAPEVTGLTEDAS